MFSFFNKTRDINIKSQELYQQAYISNKSFNNFVSILLLGSVLATGFFSYHFYNQGKGSFLDETALDASYVQNETDSVKEDLIEEDDYAYKKTDFINDNDRYSYGQRWDLEIEQSLGSNKELGSVELHRLDKLNSVTSEEINNNPTLENYLLETEQKVVKQNNGSVRGKGFHKNDIEQVMGKEAMANPLTLAYAYKNNDYTLLLAHLFIGEYSKIITENTLLNEKGKLNQFIDFIGDSVMVRRALWMTDNIANPTIADAIFQSNGYIKTKKEISFKGVQYHSMYAKKDNQYIVNKPADPFLFDLAVQAAQLYLNKRLNQIAVAPYFFNTKTSTNKEFTHSLLSGKTKFTVTSDNGLLAVHLSLAALKIGGEHTHFAASLSQDTLVVVDRKSKDNKLELAIHDIENIYTSASTGFLKTKNGKKEGVALSFAGLLEIKSKLNKMAFEQKEQKEQKNQTLNPS